MSTYHWYFSSGILIDNYITCIYEVLIYIRMVIYTQVIWSTGLLGVAACLSRRISARFESVVDRNLIPRSPCISNIWVQSIASLRALEDE